MYVYPVVLPQFSNREDFLLTVALTDDDTGEFINLDGCFTVSAMPYAGSNWVVSSGSIRTTSTTFLTIPVFPMMSASQLALQLTVATNLALVAGMPIKIADPMTGQNFMLGYVISYSTNTGTLVVQIGLAFKFEIRSIAPRATDFWGGYTPFFNVGTLNHAQPLLQATLGDGIAIVDTGVIQILIPAMIFQKLHGGTYGAALALSDSVNTRQVFIATSPIIPGGLSPLPMAASTGPLWN
jgi:hypothetical protein